MAGFVGIAVADPWLQNQFTPEELRSLKSQFLSMREGAGGSMSIEGETAALVKDSIPAVAVDFELFLRPHLDLGLISQIIKIQLLADVNLKRTQLVELVNDSKDIEELMSLPPEKILLRWMNFQLKKGEFKRIIKMKDISFLDSTADDVQVSKEERAFCLWNNSLGVSTYINNVFEDLRNGWILLESIDKVVPGLVCRKLANKPPIKMPFKKVENCNQVVRIGKLLKFALVNVAGNDIVQGNKKLILAYLWQLMRYNILQLKNLRYHSHDKELTDADIQNWANCKVKESGRHARMESFKDKSLSSGIFLLELLSAVEPRVVNWSLVTRRDSTEERKNEWQLHHLGGEEAWMLHIFATRGHTGGESEDDTHSDGEHSVCTGTWHLRIQVKILKFN